jgi:hypothetical protein
VRNQKKEELLKWDIWVNNEEINKVMKNEKLVKNFKIKAI